MATKEMLPGKEQHTRSNHSVADAGGKDKRTKTITLLRLHLRNWKMFSEFEFVPGGKNASVHGQNATGKTSLMDAFMWLLFGKDSLNRTDFAIKRLDENGEPTHRLEHEVEATISVNEVPVTLRKVFREKWVKKRGSPTESFQGHETLHYIDDVPVSETDYRKRLASIIDETTFRLLADPRYFNEVLHWSERRQILLDVCGAVSDDKVISSDERLAGLSAILGKRTIEEHRKLVQAQHARINQELKEIPVRISEVERALPVASAMDIATVDEELEETRAARKSLAEQLLRIEHGGGIAEKESELTSVAARIAESEAQARIAHQDMLAGKRRALQEAQFALSQAKKAHAAMKREAEDKQHEAEALDAELERLRAEWFEIDGEQFEWKADTACYACGQPLPEHMIEEARDKALEEFNLRKARRLEENQAKGKEKAARKKVLEHQAAKLREEAMLQEKKAAEQQRVIAGLEGELARIPETTPIKAPTYHQLTMQRDRLTLVIDDLRRGIAADAEPIRQQIADLDKRIADLESMKSRHQEYERALQRKKELLQREKLLTAEHEGLAKELYLTEEFVRAQARLLESKVASRFTLVRFKLFEPLVNGGLEETCEATVGGVPYSKGLNNSARIQAGIDIINTLAGHYGFMAPIWLDNRESVTDIPETEAQVISLIVSPEDKDLRIKVEGE